MHFHSIHHSAFSGRSRGKGSTALGNEWRQVQRCMGVHAPFSAYLGDVEPASSVSDIGMVGRSRHT